MRWDMKNKRGQFFALFLVVITLFLCGSVILLYGIQQGNAESSLVSPKVVLEVRDSLEVFEMREKELIEESLVGIEEEFCSDEFLVEFRNKFLDGVSVEMKDFIFEDLTLGGIDVFDEDKSDDFIRDVVYPEVGICNDGNFIFSRAKIGKSKYLKGEEVVKINFPVNFNYEFDREYLITFVDGEFDVEVLK
jgi:hypothetical protein